MATLATDKMVSLSLIALSSDTLVGAVESIDLGSCRAYIHGCDSRLVGVGMGKGAEEEKKKRKWERGGWGKAENGTYEDAGLDR